MNVRLRLFFSSPGFTHLPFAKPVPDAVSEIAEYFLLSSG
jgi:hypothetical protein